MKYYNFNVKSIFKLCPSDQPVKLLSNQCLILLENSQIDFILNRLNDIVFFNCTLKIL